jgi:hypothetical protein
MKFAMVKISRSRDPDHRCEYSSMIMEIGASPRWTSNFDSENEMIAVVFRLLAKQEQPPDLRRVLNQITNGTGYYFFDLDLTSEEAESLGYPMLSLSEKHQMRNECSIQEHSGRAPGTPVSNPSIHRIFT